MNINYKAYVYSKNKMLDDMPVWLKVGVPVSGKYRSVQDLCSNATENEQTWYVNNVIPHVVKTPSEQSIGDTNGSK